MTNQLEFSIPVKDKPVNKPQSKRRMMTPDELQAVERMSCVRFLPASWDKRFYRSISSVETISDKEAAQLWRIFIRYRRQMNFPGKARLLAIAETLAAPDFRKEQARLREQAEVDALKAKYLEALNQNQHHE